MTYRPCPHWKNVGVSVYITRKYNLISGGKIMKAFEVRFTNMETTVVYARSGKSAMKIAEAITYLTAVTARKLDGNGGK